MSETTGQSARQSPWPFVLALPLGIGAALLARYAVLVPVFYEEFLGKFPECALPFMLESVEGPVRVLRWACAVGAVFFLGVAVTALLRRGRWVLSWLRKSYLAGLLLFWVAVRFLKAVSIIYDVSGLKMYLLGFVTLGCAITALYVYYDVTQMAPSYVVFMYDLMTDSW